MNCNGNKKKSKEGDEVVTSFQTGKPTEKESQPKKKTSAVKKFFKGKTDDSFFKGGFKNINGEKCGIYYIEPGDNTWKIAEKFLKNYLQMDDYTKTDIGNVFEKINNVNYNELFGGVNDDLMIRQKIYIPVNYPY